MLAIGQGQVLLLGLHPVALYDLAPGCHQHLRLLRREERQIILAQHLVNRLADKLAGGPVEEDVSALLVLGEDGVFRAVGDGGEQLQRLQPLGLGVLELFGHLQPGVLAQQDDAGVGDKEHQQADETDPDALLESGLVEFRLVDLGQQIPVRVHDRIDNPEDLATPVILAIEYLGRAAFGEPQILGCQQGGVGDGIVQGESRFRAMAQATQIVDLIPLLAKEYGFSAAVWDGPGPQDLIEPAICAYLHHQHGGRSCSDLQIDQKVQPGVAAIIEIGTKTHDFALLEPCQGVTQRGIHGVATRGMPQGLSGRIEHGRTVKSAYRDEFEQPCQWWRDRFG